MLFRANKKQIGGGGGGRYYLSIRKLGIHLSKRKKEEIAVAYLHFSPLSPSTTASLKVGFNFIFEVRIKNYGTDGKTRRSTLYE